MELQEENPSELNKLKIRLTKLTKQIQFILDNTGETETDQLESSRRLKQARNERAEIVAKIVEIESKRHQIQRMPTEDDIRLLLVNLEEILQGVANGNEPENSGTLREIIELLTASRIEIEQMGERRAGHGWLRARFHLRLIKTCLAKTGFGLNTEETDGREIAVDIRAETIAEKHITRAKELYDSGMLITAIAEELGIERHQVTQALAIWHARNGASPPLDGRSRRALVPQKLLEPPIFQTIADQVKELYDKEFLIEEIAEKVKRTRDTVRAALKFWFESQGLPMPDGRNRRKSLPKKNRHKCASEG